MNGEPAHLHDASDAAPPGRRGFLAAVAAAGAALIALVAGVPLVAAVLSPLRRRGEAAGFVPVARLDALPEGRPVRASVVAERRDAWARGPAMAVGTVWLVRRGDVVTALSAVCPHLGCGVDAATDGFACPCHGSRFGPDGAVRGGPAPRALDPLEVRVVDPGRRVEVRWRRFVIGTSERREA
ncbi:MAG TPA: Rieske (2Fe-2S) protein [Anaeromyxobacteraceae bacterium]|nr:Rieske (2Fe-2S) protein [Anaeromyxobacteraceae bacterium]